MIRRFANRLIAAGVLGLVLSLVLAFGFDRIGTGALLLIGASLVGIVGICIRVVTMGGTDGGGAWGGDAGGGL